MVVNATRRNPVLGPPLRRLCLRHAGEGAGRVRRSGRIVGRYWFVGGTCSSLAILISRPTRYSASSGVVPSCTSCCMRAPYLCRWASAISCAPLAAIGLRSSTVIPLPDRPSQCYPFFTKAFGLAYAAKTPSPPGKPVGTPFHEDVFHIGSYDHEQDEIVRPRVNEEKREFIDPE